MAFPRTTDSTLSHSSEYLTSTMVGKAAQRPPKLDRSLQHSPYLESASKLSSTQPLRRCRRTQQLPPLGTPLKSGGQRVSGSCSSEHQRRRKSKRRPASTSPTHSDGEKERTISELRLRVSRLEGQLSAAEGQLIDQQQKQSVVSNTTSSSGPNGSVSTGAESVHALEKRLEAALASEKAAIARTQETEAQLTKLAQVSRRRSRGSVWRLGSKLVAQQRLAAERTSHPPPPDDFRDDPNTHLASWLTNGGTEKICRMAAKAMCNMVVPAPSSAVLDAATEAALEAAAREAYHNDHESGRPLEIIKAALNEVATQVVSECRGLSPAPATTDDNTSETTGDDDSFDAISNLSARNWWLKYIGNAVAVPLQTAIDAFVLWMENEGLPEAEATIFGALAVYGMHGCNNGHSCSSNSTHRYGLHADEGDVTVHEFGSFTENIADFSVASVRSKEIIREDEDAGSVEEFALYLGIDPEQEPELMWIAEQCRVAPLPMGWAEYMTAEGDSYFHNASRKETVWHHPLDIVFKRLVEVRRHSGIAYRPGQTYR